MTGQEFVKEQLRISEEYLQSIGVLNRIDEFLDSEEIQGLIKVLFECDVNFDIEKYEYLAPQTLKKRASMLHKKYSEQNFVEKVKNCFKQSMANRFSSYIYFAERKEKLPQYIEKTLDQSALYMNLGNITGEIAKEYVESYGDELYEGYVPQE